MNQHNTHNKIEVLILDNDVTWLREFKAALELTDEFAVHIEADPENCIRAAKHVMPDLVIIDVVWDSTGRVSGGDIAAQLLDHPQFRDIPVIFLTSKAMTEREAQRMHGTAGGMRVMIKSEPMDTIVAKLASVLWRSRRGLRN